MTRDNFREQLRRKQEAAESSPVEAETGPKTTAEMTDDELREAMTESRREILDLQHEELREREKARVLGTDRISGGVVRDPGRPLSDVFRKRPNFK